MTPVHSTADRPMDQDSTVPTDRDERRVEYRDAERILAVLADNDGQLPQSELVSELDVSKATISRRLGELEADGYVSRLLFRGQKLVWMADETPAALDSGSRLQNSD